MLLSDFVIKKTSPRAEFAFGMRKKRKDAGMKRGSRLGKIAGAVGSGVKKAGLAAGRGVGAVLKNKGVQEIAGATLAGAVVGKALGMKNSNIAKAAAAGGLAGSASVASKRLGRSLTNRRKKI